MSIVIEQVVAATPLLAAFLQAHHDDMEPTAPPESRHALPFDRLLAPGVRLFAAEADGRPIATGALAAIDEGHEELKSMRTDPAMRGRGVGRAMLDFLLTDAAARGIRRISLETGSMDFFLPARALYASAGFVECEPFGHYRPDPLSTFMTLELSAAAGATGVGTG
ncbi:GNAT family N-acetyltransferase [Microbacterium sp. 179-I 3D3 NHS]|uniref:GNAT family N-acetyltransferase n=1 Tax=unclassified Microbacterium TaxID=2609290 RepID=UPI0039A2DA61